MRRFLRTSFVTALLVAACSVPTPTPDASEEIPDSGFDAGAPKAIPLTAKSLAVGSAHACAVESNSGEVYCWGRGDAGQLGDGTNQSTVWPVKVTGLNGPALRVGAGGDRSCAALVGGGVQCWGAFSKVNRATNKFEDSSTPSEEVKVHGNAVAVQVYHNNACALSDDGQVTCWGVKGKSLGNTTTGDVLPPNTVRYYNQGSPVISLEGAYVTVRCALAIDNRAKCIGENSTGYFANGKGGLPSLESYPRSLGQEWWPFPMTAVTAGIGWGCAMKGGSNLTCWGARPIIGGELSRDDFYGSSEYPQLTDITRLYNAQGQDIFCFTTAAGAVQCLGQPMRYFAGGTPPYAVREVPGIPGPVAELGLGNYFACVRLDDQRVYCWESGDIDNPYARQSDSRDLALPSQMMRRVPAKASDAPVLVRDIEDKEAFVGDDVDFEVVAQPAKAGEKLSYTWFVNGQEDTSSTDSRLRLSALTSEQNSTVVYAQITGAKGAIETRRAGVVVRPKPLAETRNPVYLIGYRQGFKQNSDMGVNVFTLDPRPLIDLNKILRQASGVYDPEFTPGTNSLLLVGGFPDPQSLDIYNGSGAQKLNQSAYYAPASTPVGAKLEDFQFLFRAAPGRSDGVIRIHRKTRPDICLTLLDTDGTDAAKPAPTSTVTLVARATCSDDVRQLWMLERTPSDITVYDGDSNFVIRSVAPSYKGKCLGIRDYATLENLVALNTALRASNGAALKKAYQSAVGQLTKTNALGSNVGFPLEAVNCAEPLYVTHFHIGTEPTTVVDGNSDYALLHSWAIQSVLAASVAPATAASPGVGAELFPVIRLAAPPRLTRGNYRYASPLPEEAPYVTNDGGTERKLTINFKDRVILKEELAYGATFEGPAIVWGQTFGIAPGVLANAKKFVETLGGLQGGFGLAPTDAKDLTIDVTVPPKASAWLASEVRWLKGAASYYVESTLPERTNLPLMTFRQVTLEAPSGQPIVCNNTVLYEPWTPCALTWPLGVEYLRRTQ